MAEFLGDDGQGGAGGFGDAEGEMTGVAPHGDGDVPAVHGAGVFHQILDQGGAEIAGGLVTEGGKIVGQGQIIVDGFGDMGELDLAAGRAGDLHGAEGGVVAADSDHVGDAEGLEEFHRILDPVWRLGRVGARGAQDRSPVVVNAGDVADAQLLDVGLELRFIPLDQPFVAIHNAVDVEVMAPGLDGHCGDDAVQSGRRTAADKDGEIAGFHFLFRTHRRTPFIGGQHCRDCAQRRACLGRRRGLHRERGGLRPSPSG
ncbi:MAG: hypothetical protein BWY77_01321 [bacterium ADurb.Bin431]|nr:MAG: hypothetical protein BWY77_01321 [bacterium ADurb.Bin431]